MNTAAGQNDQDAEGSNSAAVFNASTGSKMGSTLRMMKLVADKQAKKSGIQQQGQKLRFGPSLDTTEKFNKTSTEQAKFQKEKANSTAQEGEFQQEELEFQTKNGQWRKENAQDGMEEEGSEQATIQEGSDRPHPPAINPFLEAARQLCSMNFWQTLSMSVDRFTDDTTFVKTGDIGVMFIRDSSIQMHQYIPLAENSPEMQNILEGTLRSQAKFLSIDPYAGAYSQNFKSDPSEEDKRVLIGGYTAIGSYEMDSGIWFLRFLKSYVDKFSTKLFQDPKDKLVFL